MKSEILFDAITDISDGLIDEAEGHVFQRTKKTALRRYAALAAVLALAVGLGALLRYGGGSTGSGNESLDAGGIAPSADAVSGAAFMSYAGPVFPLTALGDTQAVTAERDVCFDLSPYQTREEPYEGPDGETHISKRYDSAAVVTDGYTLTNSSDTERTLTLLYPVTLSFSDRVNRLPAITVDGAATAPVYYAGSWAGDFVDTMGQRGGERWNLEDLDSWEAYQALLSDGGYLSSALGDIPELEQPVTVYKLFDSVVAPTDATNPTLQMAFTMDYDKTIVLIYGSNGGTDDLETGYCSRVVGGLGNEYRTPEPMYVILVGDDIEEYTLQGYRNMGENAGEEIDVTATVERTETTLGEILRQLVEQASAGWETMYGDGKTPVSAAVPAELIYDCTAELMASYGPLIPDGAERYQGGMLEGLINEARSMKRVLYLAFDVTIPAGESVKVEASMVKSASFDFPGAGERDSSIHGYDLVTQLGSSLTFTAQTVSVSGTGEAEILDSSLGLDPDTGVTQVQLDLAEEHHWLSLRKRGED